ncbi:MAG: GNAT family N-acetyltransferase [Clostridiales bacterium]|nr:GNAT family N-acetyltransferase [Candidatus Blautia equi]
MKNEAFQRGYSQIELDVWEFNDDAISFYFNQGFTRVRQFLELDCIPENSFFKEHYALRSILPDDAERAAYIEAECFPPSEACTLSIMKERVVAASDCFIAAVDRSTMQIIGFINGLCTSEANLKDELFTDTGLHDPNGENIMICSVAVLPEYQRQGIARAMMAEFLRRQKLAGRKEAILTCVPGKISMYEKFGFIDRGESDSTWGGEKWHEMSCRLN